MAQSIKLKRSAVAGRIPTTANLALGELAINVKDGKLFFQRDDSTIQTILTTNASITGDLTMVGTVTATSFSGDGSNLTGIAATLDEVTDNGATTTNSITVGGINSSGSIILANNQELRWQDSSGTARRILELTSTDLLELEAPGRIRLNPGGSTAIDLFDGHSTKYTISSVHSFFDASANEAVRITGDGKVGIGTTSASHKLTVHGGGAFIKSDLNDGSAILTIRSSDNYGYAFARSNNTGHLELDGNQDGFIGYTFKSGTAGEIFKLESDGDIILSKYGAGNKVGAGNPAYALAVDASGNIIETAVQSVPTGGSGTDNYLAKWVNTSELGNSTIFDDGTNVGIGTATPNAKLEVFGNGGTILDIQGSNGQLFSVTDSLTGSLMSVNDISGLPILEVFDNDKVVMGEFGSNALVVTGSNVGIGTDTPSYKLDVQGTGRFTDTLSANGVVYTGGTIGQAKTALFTNNVLYTRGGSAGHFLQNADGSEGMFLANDHIRFESNSIERMRINSAGNVGIGTTSPSHKLHLVGSNNTTPVRFDIGDDATFNFAANSTSGYSATFNITDTGLDIGHDSSVRAINLKTFNTDRLTILGGGNVGIGTTTPYTSLEVNGGLHVGPHSTVLNPTSGILIETPQGESAQLQMYVYNGSVFGMSSDGTTATVGWNSGGDREVNIVNSGAGAIKMGVGTGAPTRTLDVVGDVVIGNTGVASKYFLKRPSDSNQAAYFGYHTVNNGDFGISNQSGGGNIYLDSNNGALRFYNTSTSAVLFNVANNGNTTVNGDLTVSGTITAQEFRAEFITNTIILESGSTQFGDSADDTHTFTGKLSVLGNGADPDPEDYNNALTLAVNAGENAGDTGAGLFFKQKWHGPSTELVNVGGIVGVKTNGSGTYGGGLAFYAQPAGAADSFEVMRYNSSGRVGIGTTSPDSKLSIKAAAGEEGLKIRNVNNQDTFHLGHLSSEDSYFQMKNNAGTAQVLLRTDNNLSYINTGNLGIGTTTPSQRLHVAGKARITDDIQLTGSNPRLDFNTNGASSLRFYDTTNAAERMRINDAGNVGIGDTAPSFILDVNSTNSRVRFKANSGDSNLEISSIAGHDWLLQSKADGEFRIYDEDSAAARLNIKTSGILQLPAYGAGVLTTDSAGNVGVSTGYQTQATADSRYVNVTGDTMTGKLTLNQNTTIGGTTPTNGNLVITDGSFSLGIDSNEIHSTNAMYIGTNSGNLILRPDGNTTITNGKLGVGTATPGHLLEATGTIRATASSSAVGVDGAGLEVRYNTTDGAGSLLAYDRGNSAYKELRVEGSIIAIRESGSEIARFDGGNLGIGTTSPSAKLHIANTSGDANIALAGSSGQVLSIDQNSIRTTTASQIAIFTNSNVNNGLYITSAGNVGIGTTTPSDKLHVKGVATIEDTAKVSQTGREVDGDPAGTSMIALSGALHIGAFVDYTIYSDDKTNMRSGTIQMVFDEIGNAQFTDNSTLDIGNTSPATFGIDASVLPTVRLLFNAPDSTWHVRYHVRYL